MLPKALPALPGVTFAAGRRAARSVSGDYFDAVPLGSQVVLCIGDVIGKGVPAAMLMSNLQAAVRAGCTPDVEPGTLCARLNNAMCENMPSGKFITFVCCVLDAERKTLSYSNAGHSAPVLIRANGELVRLDQGGMVLGLFHDVVYQQATVALAPGDRLLLFTDGVTEARNAEGEEFGDDRLIAEAMMARTLPPAALKDRLLATATTFGDLHDDATLLVAAVD